MQSLRWNGIENAPHGVRPVGTLSDRDGWSNLIAHGALTPGLLALFMVAATGATLMHAPAARADGKTIAAAEASTPQVALQSPTHADQLRGTTQIRVAIKAGRYPAASLEMYVDNRLATSGAIPLDANMLPVAVFNWDTKIFADGPHLLSVIVADSQGFKGRSDVQVYINNRGESDVTPPTVRWLNVRHGDVITGEFPVQVEATDNFGVKWVIITLNRAISPALKPPLRSAMANIPPYILRLRGDLPPDRYVLNAMAVDAKDNQGAAPPIEILISPRISPVFGTPNIPVTGIGPIPVGPDNPSNGGTTNVRTVTVPPETVATGPAAPEPANVGPRVTMPMQEKLAGENGLMSGITGQVSARAGSVERRHDVLLAESVPAGAQRALPPAPPAVSVGVRGQGQANGHIATGNIPSEHSQRAATKTQMVAAVPVLAQRSQPAAGQLTSQSASINQAVVAKWQADFSHVNVSHSAPRPVASLPESAKRTVPAETQVNRATPRSEMRVAGQQRAIERGSRQFAGLMVRPTSEARTSGAVPTEAQLSAPGMGRTTIAQTEPVAPTRIPGHLIASAAMPSAASRALPKAAEATAQLTALAQAGTNVARTAPVVTRKSHTPAAVAAAPSGAVRMAVSDTVQTTALSAVASNVAHSGLELAHSPRLSAVPIGVPSYPRIPSPLMGASGNRLAPSLPKTTLPKATLPKATLPKATLPKATLAMNPPMPGKTTNRPLAAITVAPQSQWSAQAEPLPASHVARRDETLSTIAQHYAMPVSVLAAANKLPEAAIVPAGRSVSLPRALSITYAGKPVTGDTPSFQMGTVGVTPFRFLFEKQGGKLTWNAKTHQVTAVGPQGKVALTIGSRSAVVNQKETLMDLAAFLMTGRTMVPVRFFEQALHAQVDWDPATGRFYVAANGPAAG